MVGFYCLDRDAVEPLAVFAQVETVDADKPVGRGHHLRDERHLVFLKAKASIIVS